MPQIFYPASLSFVKKNAKLLQRAFPALSLSTAQEATACALGFTSWFDCTKRVGHPSTSPSLPDQQLPPAERLQRRYQQIRALVDVASLPVGEVDYFVRCWNLTSEIPAIRIAEFETDFDVSDRNLTALAVGKMTEEELEEYYGWNGVPSRVADGIIHGPCGLKHEYYQLSCKRLLDMPLYLRGNASIFLDSENGGFVALVFPECFDDQEKAAGLKFMMQQEPWLYEWHTGKPPADFHGVSIRQMADAAAKAPEDWYALSVRFSTENNKKQPGYAVPALRGADFIRFIEAKGSLRGLDLQWFGLKNEQTVYRFTDLPWGSEIRSGEASNRFSANEAQPIAPLFGSPFKHGPMCHIEFMINMEGGGMHLADELEDEGDDEDSEGGMTEAEFMARLPEQFSKPQS